MSRYFQWMVTVTVVGLVAACSSEPPKSVSAKPNTSLAEPVDSPAKELLPGDIVRVSPAEIKPLVEKGDALLVCAYDSDEKFATVQLEGAIAQSALAVKESTLAKDTRLVFY